MQRITVPGGWVEFREPEETPERLRRKVLLLSSNTGALQERLASNEDVAISDVEFFTAFNDAVALCLITQWSFANPLTTDGLQDLPGNVYDEIIKHVQPLTPRLMPNFGVDPSPKAPTENFSA